ncbi:Staphylopine export protein [Sporomusa silvacetica DSM 10669]|uniref:Staphylopine export protein n=1 Tax=Sporomusa silvacetica DSM 10669 TaxID=1123289 RepID=A0ABZ3IJE7_9FIRM|nr:MFS transporter [Sporomusa silvacetica]OZC15627.1 tetracycline resistance protein, class B [Sporomusa silvacetica DSM 10669]
MENQNVFEQQLWTKNYMLVCFGNLLVFTSFYCLLPTLPIYVIDVLSGDSSDIGYIFGIFALAAVLARPLAGYLLDTGGRKVILLVSLCCLTLVIAFYNMAVSIFLLFTARAVHGFCWGVATTASGTVATDIIPAAQRGEGIGYFGLSATLAMAVGPLVGLEIVGFAGFTYLFNVSFGLAAVASLCMTGIAYKECIRGVSSSKLSNLFEPRVFLHATISFFIAVLYGGVLSFIVVFGKEIGVANPGTYFLAYAGALIISRPYAGRTFDLKGPFKIMAWGFVALGLSFVLLFFSKGFSLFVTSAVLFGVGFGVIQSTTLAMAINKVDPFSRGLANGTIMTAFDLGVGLGSILLGALSKFMGLATMFLVCSCVAIIPCILFFRYYTCEDKIASGNSNMLG